MTVVDLGQHARGTTGACFWLCLAAGLSRIGWNAPAASDAFSDSEPALVHRVAAMSFEDLNVGCRSRALDKSPVGELAARLRQHFCVGPQAILLQPRVVQTVFPAFALIAARADRGGINDYKRWVGRLGCTEYADELIIHTAARGLGIKLRIVPYTPRTAAGTWNISEYPHPDADDHPPDANGGQFITMGNNDVHFVWLAPSE